jgi:hypothetical protein
MFHLSVDFHVQEFIRMKTGKILLPFPGQAKEIFPVCTQRILKVTGDEIRISGHY